MTSGFYGDLPIYLSHWKDDDVFSLAKDMFLAAEDLTLQDRYGAVLFSVPDDMSADTARELTQWVIDSSAIAQVHRLACVCYQYDPDGGEQDRKYAFVMPVPDSIEPEFHRITSLYDQVIRLVPTIPPAIEEESGQDESDTPTSPTNS